VSGETSPPLYDESLASANLITLQTKMVEARLAPIKLRFGTKGSLDALTHKQQDGSGVADGFVEHPMLT
jgi:hypothetical protein